MTPRQRSYFFSYLWPETCRRRGWDPQDRSTRREFFAAVLGTDEPKSFADFTEVDYDRVKARCLAEIKPGDLNAQLASGDQRRRRLLDQVATLKACLGLYVQNPDGYVQAILRNRFHDQLPDEMDERDLLNLLRTLAGRVNGARGFRAQAGDSLHAMHTRAGTGECPCAACRSGKSGGVGECGSRGDGRPASEGAPPHSHTPLPPYTQTL